MSRWLLLAPPPSAGKNTAEFMSNCDRLQSFRLVNLMDPVPRSVQVLDSATTTIARGARGATAAATFGATTGTSLGLPEDRWLYHLGSPITLDDCLTESLGMLATVADAFASDLGLLENAKNMGATALGHAVNYHDMNVYIENLGMYMGEPDPVKTAECVARVTK